MTFVTYRSKTGIKKTKNCVQTPKFLLDYLTTTFGTLYDPCPILNEKFDPKKHTDGLKLDWKKETENGKVVYINPPFSSTKFWFIKAQNERIRGVKSILLVKTTIANNKFFTKYCQNCQLVFFDFRFPFVGFTTFPVFKLMFVIFDPENLVPSYSSITKDAFSKFD